jgi:uncharacterized protein
LEGIADMRIEREEIKIRISGLSNGLHEYHFVASPADVGLDDAFRKPVSLDVALEKSSRQIYLKADIASEGNFTCDRCLDDFSTAIASKLSIFYAFSEPEAENAEGDDVRILTPETMYLEITDDVRQSIMLAVPLKLLCMEECKGLCPHCGINRNRQSCKCHEQEETDTRWEKLKKIL